MDQETTLTNNFVCAKCRNRKAVSRTVTIGGGLATLLHPTADKYILVSCTLCGFTELYNALVIAEVAEGEPIVEELPQQG